MIEKSLIRRLRFAFFLLRKPSEFIYFSFWIAKKGTYKIKRSLGWKLLNYPPKVYLAYLRLPKAVCVRSEPFTSEACTLLINTGLVSGLYSQDELFFADFNDPEIKSSVHRWSWLFYGGMNKQSITKKLDFVDFWINEFGAQNQKTIDDSYDCSERISNLCIFLLMLKTPVKGKLTKYRNIVRKFAYSLASNLEYKEKPATGNHVFNNGRAIFYAGVFCGDANLVRLAMELFSERIPNLITSDGFLSEGSSHYHLLFHSWLLAIVAHARKYRIPEVDILLSPVLGVVEKRSRFFVDASLGKPLFPVIGDVSPDASPERILSVSFCKLDGDTIVYEGPSALLINDSWATVFADKKRLKKSSELFQNKKEIEEFPNSGWWRWKHLGWTLFMHNPHHVSLEKAGHFHEDFLSFVLFHKASPVVVDLGRKNYLPTDYFAQSQRLSHLHNSPRLNNFSPACFVPNRQDIPPYSKRFNMRLEVVEKSGEVIIEIRHDGFSKFFPTVSHHSRVFILSKGKFAVKDTFFGTGYYEFESNFNLSLAAKAVQGTELPLVGQDKIGFSTYFYLNDKTKELKTEKINGLSERYGLVEGVSRIAFRSREALPFQAEFKIGVNE